MKAASFLSARIVDIKVYMIDLTAIPYAAWSFGIAVF